MNRLEFVIANRNRGKVSEMKSWNEIRKAATAFSKRWKDAFDEKSQAQSFLKEFFAVFGVDTVTVATFEHRVKFSDGSQGYADCFWQGRILVEMKSRGKDLDAAFQQALDYVRALSDVSQTPRAIVVSDFARVRFYDLANDCALTEFPLRDLRKFVTLFGFMIGADERGEIREQDPVNRKAAEKMARLHDAMKAVGYTGHPLEVYLVRLLFCLFAEDTGIFKPDQFSLCVGERTAPDGSDLAAKLAELFQVLNTPNEKRLASRDETIAKFPYVNGGLFAEMLPIAAFSADMRKALLDCAGLDWSKISPAIFGAMFQGVMEEKARHDLGAHYTAEEYILRLIRPLFLDALRVEFNAICALNGRAKETRLKAFHEKIASFTFLDPACGCGNFLLIAYRELRRLEMDVLEELHKDDPEQFLDISQLCKVSVSQFYGIEIEQFPAEIAKVALWLMDHLCNMEVADRFGQYFVRIPIKVSPHIVCANALTMDWGGLLTSDARLQEESKSDVRCPKSFSYILGNPPFLGRTQKGPEQQAEIAQFFDYKDIDYVACWYAKANDYMNGARALPGDGRAVAPRPPLHTRCAFVSTNSITQGEQVAPLWRRMNAEIDFAYQTFKWHNEAKGVAAVHCVIIGFHAKGNGGFIETALPPSGRAASTMPPQKAIYSTDGTPHYVEHINGYLMSAPDVYFAGRSKPLWETAPALTMGNMPLDGGNLIIEAEDLPQFVENGGRGATALPSGHAGRVTLPGIGGAGRLDPPPCQGTGSPLPADLPPFIKRLTGSREYIQGLPRYCLWLKDVEPSLIRSMPLVMERVAKCREWRLASKSADTRKHAATPTLFREQKNPKTAIIIPKVSSKRRDYVPIGFIDDSVIVTDLAFIIPDATLYHFGILTSRMHNAWMRAVAGRLKSDYRYSKDIVYNNFPWPEVENVANVKMLPNPNTNIQSTYAKATADKLGTGNIGTGNTSTMATISNTAQAILNARARYPESSLADLYDQLTMPPDLRAAHEANDRAVLAAYGLAPDTPEPEIVAHLFKLYAGKCKNLK